MIYLKTEEEIELLRENNLLVSQTLAEVGRHIKPGVTTKQLDGIIEDFIRSHGATPAFLGYQGYPASACISVNEHIYWLSRIINAESAGESMRGKVAVGNVVLNRVESHLYADNIYDVIFDTQYGVQFTPAANGTIYNEPSGDSIVAAKRAFLGEENVGNCLYFLNPRISTNFWIVNNRTFYKTIGNHDFYL